MQNINIHETLEDKEVRDFLAKSLNDCSTGDSAYLAEQIKLLQAELENAKRAEATLALIKSKGWTYFDVSDDICDYHSSTYFPFIGTEAELKAVGL